MATLQQTIRALWTAKVPAADRRRPDFENFYRLALIQAGKKPVRAVVDIFGTCETCSQSEHCPGWHYDGETVSAPRRELGDVAQEQFALS